MLYYLGKGSTFRKDDCKVYKTIDGALKAVAKSEDLTVWDEDGNEITSKKNTEINQENNNTTSIIPQGKMRITVICDGLLRLRRSPEWNNENICGYATRGQSFNVKEVLNIDNRKMVRTIGGLYLSGASEYVQFEQCE